MLTDNEKALALCKNNHLRVEFSQGDYEIERYVDTCTENCGGHHHSYDWKFAARDSDFLKAVEKALTK